MANNPTVNFLIPKPEAGDLNWEDEYATLADTADTIGMKTGRNTLINGSFDLWDLGDSFPSANTGDLTANRWIVWDKGQASGQVDITRQVVTPNSFPGESQGSFRWDVVAAGDGFFRIMQRIENILPFEGQTVALSFWAKSSNARTVTPDLRINYGTGGSAQEAVTGDFGAKSITTTWQRFTGTVSMPNYSGKTIGTPGTHYIEFEFAQTGAVAGSVDFANVQLEIGSVATDFEQRSIAHEKVLARRYLRSVAVATGTASSATQVNLSINHPGMRITPFAVAFPALSIDDNQPNGNHVQSAANVAIINNTSEGGRYSVQNFTGLTVGRWYTLDPVLGGTIWLAAEF